CAGQEMGQAVFRKMTGEIKLVSVSEYNNPYNGGGREALVDGVRGGADFRTGSWQGWQGKNVEVLLDLGEVKPISSISVSVLQETKSWIWFPSKMEVLISDDGNKYTPTGYVLNDKPLDIEEALLNEMAKTMRGQGRYVKIILYPAFEKIPEWHLGAGGKPWIFADEIIIR
ncbi:MAG: discoidin domain-containing protein, partial [Flavobacteriales bacterium]